jgi:8-oxo-dGTP pyrophosphatase MutT (NUDIX family)
MADETDEIVAAGGLVRSGAPANSAANSAPKQAVVSNKILIVHRPKYDDWSFPKGKADPGESIEQTALREVREETGLECRIIGPLSSVRYTYEGKRSIPRPKVVHYFLMEPAGGSLVVNGYEIDQAEWVEPQEALRRLTYDHDRRLLSGALPGW